MNPTSLCHTYDQWLKDQDKTVWIAEIPGSGGTLHVYQDDGRPGTEGTAWERLGNSVRDNRCHRSILSFSCGFRDHIESLDMPLRPIDGIYFSKGAIADMLNPHTCNCYVLGWIKDGVLTKVWYRIPEVIEYQREVLTEFDKDSPSIIWCK